MRKFVLALLLQAFIFVIVHDYVIESIDSETQSELYLYASGQLSQPCDVSKMHQVLHDSMTAVEIPYIMMPEANITDKSQRDMTQFVLSFFPQSIYYPPIV